jgi:maltooligosyltrehalose trehalohydrolase
MTLFRVWAPGNETPIHSVELQLDDRRLPMTATGRGWWERDVPRTTAGQDYAFILDGGQSLPDPRSPWQPQGVHGPSRVVDHTAFAWTDDDWSAPSSLGSAVLYELHIGTFTPEGTFRAAIDRLDDLRELGVTHIELLPVADFPGEHGWGYDGVALYAPKEAYGGPQGLKELVNAAHQRGLAVILDAVYNHLGPDGNYLSQFGPYFTGRYHTPWGEAINFDGPGSDEVRRFFLDNALMWLRDYHFDGLRLDAVHAIYDHSALHFLEELAQEVHQLQEALGRPLLLIAESDLNDPRIVRPVHAGGYGIHTQWSDDFHHALHTVLTGEQDGYYRDFGSLAQLACALRRAYVYAGDYSAFRQRRHGRVPCVRPGDESLTLLSGDHFLAYAQNHDQIGNRAQGERLAQLVNDDQLKIAAALLFTSPFVPMLFQGEEWAASSPFLYFADHQDPELARAVSEGRRQEFAAFGWNPDDVPDPESPETFRRSKLNWQERENEPHATILDWHRRLIRLRHERPALGNHRLESVTVDFDEEARWLILHRPPLATVCNLAGHSQQLPLPKLPQATLLASDPEITLQGRTITLPAHSVAILSFD